MKHFWSTKTALSCSVWFATLGCLFCFASGPRGVAEKNEGSEFVHSAPSARRSGARSTVGAKKLKSTSANFSRVTPRRNVVLPSLDENFLRELKRQDAAKSNRRLRIGLGRSLNEPLIVNSNAIATSDWNLMPDGTRVFSFSVTAQGALGLRLH